MKFLDRYECDMLEDGNMILKFTPVENYQTIFVGVSQDDEYITIFDGGSLVAALKPIYNFKSQEFLTKFIEICKTKKISKNGNVMFLQCLPQDFDARLADFVDALNLICRI